MSRVSVVDPRHSLTRIREARCRLGGGPAQLVGNVATEQFDQCGEQPVEFFTYGCDVGVAVLAKSRLGWSTANLVSPSVSAYIRVRNGA